MKPFIGMMAILALASCSSEERDWTKPDTITLGCENYQSIPLDHAILYNNVWNKDAADGYEWKQCLEQKPGADRPVYGWSWHWPNTGRQIFAYPQIKVGSSPWDPLPKIDDRFPAKIDQLESLVVSHDLEIEANGQFNVATSMWLTNSPNIGDSPNKSIIAAEVMIWTFATAEHMNPAGQNIGSIEHDGRKWSVWLNEDWGDASGQNENKWIYITFQAEEPTLSNRFDAIALLSDDLLSGLGLEKAYIADIELGTEIMRGDGLVWVDSFNVEMTKR